jgi:LmbE family N-acetylglucosaminyl deacetylase
MGSAAGSVLIVAAHPDDEVLGCGGAAAALAASGVPVQACLLSGDVEVRQQRPDVTVFHQQVAAAQRTLGMQPAVLGHFPNIRFNTVPHLELVQFIEQAIVDSGADVVFTHHPSDINDDHRATSGACQAAVRLFQRRAGIAPLRGFYFMEVVSSTDWSFSTTDTFRPDAFFAIGEELLERKLAALACYEGVIRPYPHPRSPEAIRGLSAYRGGQAGRAYAEAFQTAYQDLDHLLSVDVP